jgi:hypothetical protein
MGVKNLSQTKERAYQQTTQVSGLRLSVMCPPHSFKELEGVAKLEYGEPRILAGIFEICQSDLAVCMAITN